MRLGCCQSLESRQRLRFNLEASPDPECQCKVFVEVGFRLRQIYFGQIWEKTA
jgi:hypothetical protein